MPTGSEWWEAESISIRETKWKKKAETAAGTQIFSPPGTVVKHRRQGRNAGNGVENRRNS